MSRGRGAHLGEGCCEEAVEVECEVWKGNCNITQRLVERKE